MLKRLVAKNTTASTINIIPKAPEMVPEKYKYPITIANMALRTLSAFPMFFFMIFKNLIVEIIE
jgi:hypothetical protein